MQCLLDESLEISNVINAKNEYQRWLDSQEMLIIDASPVTRIDAAGLQALAALFVSAKQTNVEIQMINVPEQVSAGIALLDLTSLFEG
ncbi:STAS domain-containing protein [Vibrio sp. SCSIO 43136]|uniref:STAS domain-containing protein n=1 Tax=Vibrio sp. SCSIO 43136 TaxID=2819101 RepID=UPI0020763725|nr:STAS domain-containing protein [Vibrio sp. SCSIO 43136]USD67488.1 STAS domain-containing protein [Vibrio sp. SCSIO 43136]